MARQEPCSAIQPPNYESKYAMPQYIAENEWGEGEVPGHEEVRENGRAGKGRRANRRGRRLGGVESPPRKSICERLLTVPPYPTLSLRLQCFSYAI